MATGASETPGRRVASDVAVPIAITLGTLLGYLAAGHAGFVHPDEVALASRVVSSSGGDPIGWIAGASSHPGPLLVAASRAVASLTSALGMDLERALIASGALFGSLAVLAAYRLARVLGAGHPIASGVALLVGANPLLVAEATAASGHSLAIALVLGALGMVMAPDVHLRHGLLAAALAAGAMLTLPTTWLASATVGLVLLVREPAAPRPFGAFAIAFVAAVVAMLGGRLGPGASPSAMFGSTGLPSLHDLAPGAGDLARAVLPIGLGLAAIAVAHGGRMLRILAAWTGVALVHAFLAGELFPRSLALPAAVLSLLVARGLTDVLGGGALARARPAAVAIGVLGLIIVPLVDAWPAMQLRSRVSGPRTLASWIDAETPATTAVLADRMAPFVAYYTRRELIVPRHDPAVAAPREEAVRIARAIGEALVSGRRVVVLRESLARDPEALTSRLLNANFASRTVAELTLEEDARSAFRSPRTHELVTELALPPERSNR